MFENDTAVLEMKMELWKVYAQQTEGHTDIYWTNIYHSAQVRQQQQQQQ